MNKYFEKYGDILLSLPLFEGMRSDEVLRFLTSCRAFVTDFNGGDVIFSAGDSARFIGAVLSGSARIVRDDFYGNRNIIAHTERGELFGEAFALAGEKHLPVSVLAAERSAVLFMDGHFLLSDGGRAALNMLKIASRKNVVLNNKIEVMSKRTTREKLLAYFLQQSEKCGSNEFTIPFNRQELADFLSVDRSAMCTELGRLSRGGLIEFRKNRFKLVRV